MKIKFNSFENVLMSLLLVLVWSITAIRAVITSITYDEAHTALYYASVPWGFLNLELANNHPLNTLLIYLSTRILGYSFEEVIIRLPNLIFFAIYLLAVKSMASRWKHKWVIFVTLVFNYYLTEYFGLARGYGLAAALNLAAFTVYFSDRKDQKNIMIAIGLLLAASTAIFTNLALLISFSLYVLFVDLKIEGIIKLSNRYWYLIAPMALLTIFLAYAILRVTEEGLPLYGAIGTSFYSAIFMSFTRMFLTTPLLVQVLTLGYVIVLLTGYLINLKSIDRAPFMTIFITLILLIWVTSTLLRKPLPTNRILVPFYPIFALALFESISTILEKLSIKNQTYFKPLLIVISLIMVFTFFRSVRIESTSDYNEDYPKKFVVYEYFIKGKPIPEAVEGPIASFYSKKIEYDLYERYPIDNGVN